jgi:hypothetical protein
MSKDYEVEARIRDQVEKRLNARKELIIHAVVFVPINLALWVIWLYVGTDVFPFPLIVLLGWGAGFAAHALTYYSEHGGLERREAYIQREVERIWEQIYGEKRKNDQRLRLTEDGELENEIESYTDGNQESAQRRS